jgi:hypothetical protein
VARTIGWTLTGALLLAVGFVSLNQPGGPAREMVAIVESSGFRPSEYSLSDNTASVRLDDGRIVRAKVRTASIPLVGQKVKVVELRRVLTGQLVYEVHGPGS